jgi:uncharacterized membrane protein
VGSGQLDFGITGRDLAAESDAPVTERLALGFGSSSFRYAAPAGRQWTVADLAGKRIATAYPNLVRKDLADKAIEATVIRLDGAVEISIQLGVADAPHGHWSSWLGNIIAVVVLSLLALGELITDQLPKTPSRTVPAQFGARIVIGALAGAVIGTPFGHIFSGIGAGMIGAVLGTMGGAQVRSALAAKFGKDRPAALLEDVVAIVGGFVIVYLAGVSLA